MSPKISDIKAAALEYARNGLKIFPCDRATKRPLVEHGFYAASKDLAQVEEWWDEHPGASIGCATGEVNGLLVLDIDLPDGPDSLADLEAEHGPLPRTREQITGSGGRHRFFIYPFGHNVPSSASKIGKKLDIRANKGYVILPPSGHVSGNSYAWDFASEPEPAEAPEWLVKLASAPTAKTRKAKAKQPTDASTATLELPDKAEGTTPYGRKALENEAAAVAVTQEGGRNGALNSAAFALGQLVAGGELDPDEAEEALLKAALECGLPEPEANKTIASGMGAGMLESRSAPKPDEQPEQAVQGQEFCKPEIFIKGGKLPELVDQCEELLLKPELPQKYRIFQRGGGLTRIVSLPSTGFSAGITRHQGVVIIAPVERAFLQDILGRNGIFTKFDAKQKKIKDVDVPKALAETLLARQGLWKFPALRGVTLSPTLRPDGSILDKPGYDVATGFYLATSMKVNVPEKPTREEARAALEFLKDLLVEFPFVTDVDRAVALALILSGVVRPAVETVPLFGFTAPAAGSGKSTLIDVASALATGSPASVVAATKDPVELRKRLESCMLAGDSMVSLDNINGTLTSDLLCQATTQASVKIRPLGGSEQQEVPNTAVFSANGNNLGVSGDLCRRTLMCKLDSKLERPDARVFEYDPVAMVMGNRGQYVSAVLTILRGYVVAGKPDINLSKFGSFEQWSDLVRSGLVWAGASDPCESRTAIISDDPELAALEAVLEAWTASFDNTARTVNEVARLVMENTDSDYLLVESITTVASDRRGFIDKQKLGIWFGKNAGRIAGGRMLQRHSVKNGVAQWKVVDA